jgi:antirestriction protein ArdC
MRQGTTTKGKIMTVKAKKKKTFGERQTAIYKKMNDRMIGFMESLITSIQNGEEVKYKKPWECLSHFDAPINLKTKKAYRGINVVILTIRAMISGYERNIWLTMRQAQEMHKDFHEWKEVKGRNGKTKKIAVDKAGKLIKPIKLDELKASEPIFFKKRIVREVEDKQTKEKDVKIFFMLKEYYVYNVEQCQGIEHRLPKTEKKEEKTFNPIKKAKAIIDAFKKAPKMNHGGGVAAYYPLKDIITMPKPESFDNAESYYSVAFHELAHSTGHESRLNRKGIAQFDGHGTYNYGEEELIAELTSAMLCGECGIIDTVSDNAIGYLQHWVKAIREDEKILFNAASKAQKAADYIQNIEVKYEEDPKKKESKKESKVAVAA